MRIVFFGTDQFAAEILRHLLDAGCNIVAVVTRPDKEKGRSLKLLPPPVKEMLIEKGSEIPVFQPIRASNETFIHEMVSFKPDLFVVVSYGQIIKEALLDVPKIGSINVHPSLLPRYRGPSPIQSAVLAGEKEVGVTIMEMSLEMDAGDMIRVEKMSLPEEMTYGDLQWELCNQAKNLLVDVIFDIEKKQKIEGEPQNHEKATYTKKILPIDAFIDWSRSTREICNLIRGMNPRPGARTYIQVEGEKKLLKIFTVKPVVGGKKVSPGEVVSFDFIKGFVIGCGDGVIQILTLQLEGKKEMTARDFINGFSLPQIV